MTTPNLPLVVDLDGTLTPTDTLAEAVIQLIRQSPANLALLVFRLFRGRAAFKQYVASRSSFSAKTLPIREPLLTYLRAEKTKGRQLVLATASHESVAKQVASHVGIFDHAIGTQGKTNLKGENKLRAIRRTVGERFVYAGDSAADLPIWKAAEAAILVGAPRRVALTVRASTPIEWELARSRPRLATWTKALRIHQWLKNLLIFVPLVTAFSFMDVQSLLTSTIAFVAFSLAASAGYIVNDLWDLENDRHHPYKRARPIANADISINSAISVSAITLLVALFFASTISRQFTFLLVFYLLLTSAYSWLLKSYFIIDVIVLSVLYTLRIIAGSIAIEVPTSTWLLAFSVFIFLSLALVKRCSELVSLKTVDGEATRGRDYRVSDLVVLWPLGMSTAMASVVVFGLFISAPETEARYESSLMLWTVALGLIYWLSRLWIKTARGEMHEDPVVYAVRDKGSRLLILVIAAAMIAAHYVKLDGLR
jgi:4-hydroxybenzoate polyprenyltransferase/phosphoserine phosphatase